MATEDLFSTDEWMALREAPHLVAMATALAGSSGMFGTIGEMFTTAKILYEGAASSHELIRLLTSKEEMDGARESVEVTVKAGDPAHVKESLQAAALARVRQAMEALRVRSPEDAVPYRAWLQSIAQRIAESSKEGGFLGFGGERVSAGERDFLAKLQIAVA